MTHANRGKLNRAVVVVAAICAIGVAGAGASTIAYYRTTQPYAESVVKLKDVKEKHGLRELEIKDTFLSCLKGSVGTRDPDYAVTQCFDEQATAIAKSDSELKAASQKERENYFTIASLVQLIGLSLLASTFTGLLLVVRRKICKTKGLDLFFDKPKPQAEPEINPAMREPGGDS
ncbi:MAG: hypothetical protein WCT31_00635 [Candidatus Micrarchaeia archaeon]|jgi:hypothetical protein